MFFYQWLSSQIIDCLRSNQDGNISNIGRAGETLLILGRGEMFRLFRA